ncbi:MAG: DUF4388 domain-containing protein [Chitinispirillaceae bacterium]|nr:DUF4388 domain-containing protein [Chitinispirillaceae bacterium]
MLISGTLREFILADVMQLLAQQKITGKLILDNGKKEGYVFFKDGLVVSAMYEGESFQAKLFCFFTEIRQETKSKVREFFSKYEGRIAELTQYIENKGILAHEELYNYATNLIMDIACSFFFWKGGQYKFEALRTVDHLIPAGVSIPVENIVMEAMRRVDEWNRIRKNFNEETIFMHTDKKVDLSNFNNPLEKPELYLYLRIDGTTPVKDLLSDAFISEYRTYESINFLLTEGLIVPLPETVTQSIRAAIRKKEEEKYFGSPVLANLLSFLITAGCILIILVMSWLWKGVVLADLNVKAYLRKKSVETKIAERNFLEAKRYFSAKYMRYYPEDLKPEDFSGISKRDAFYLSEVKDSLIKR